MYNFDLVLIVGDKQYYENYCKSWLKLKDETKSDNQGGETFLMEKNKIPYSVVWLPKIDFTSTNYGVLGHELLHVALNVMKFIGFKFDYDNTEPINYYFEYLYTETLWRLVRHLKK